MKCDICNKESDWLEVIGSNFVCHACIQKHNPLLGKILRTHMESFERMLKRKKPKDFEEFKHYTREDIKTVIDVSKALNVK